MVLYWFWPLKICLSPFQSTAMAATAGMASSSVQLTTVTPNFSSVSFITSDSAVLPRQVTSVAFPPSSE